MASTYSNLKIQLMGTGDNNTSWGDVTNVNIGAALGAAIARTQDIAFTSADIPLPWTDVNTPQDARNLRLNLTGTGGFNLIIPVITGGKPYIINNATNGTITVKHATGTGIAVPTGKTMWVYADGTNVVDVISYLPAITTTNLTATTVLDPTTIGAASPGFRGLPQNAKTASYTLELSDAGKHISITTGGVIIPANSSVAFPVGTTIVIYNASAVPSTQTINITTDTLRLAGTANTGSRTLAIYGLATCVKVAATTWVVSGNVS